MDQRWRPFPPPQPTFCPTCSSPHFPFCPPPPMPTPTPPSFHRPLNPLLPQPYPYNHEITYQPPGNHHAYRAPYPGAENDGSLRKRMRVDDPLGFQQQDFSNDERRSKLIRDHGSGPGVGNGNGYGLPYASNPRSYTYHGSNSDYYAPDGRIPISQRGVAYGDPRGESSPEMSRYGGGNTVGVGGRHYSFEPIRPPLPPSPPPPLPSHPPMQIPMTNGGGFSQLIERTSGALFPVNSNVSTTSPLNYSLTRQGPCPSSAFGEEDVRKVPPKPKIVDASSLFKHPHRTVRPDHFVVIFRGLPGSGKSYMAKMLRDLEVEQGGTTPRIFSIDDYFMTEVEKAEESEALNTLSKDKRPAVKKVMEYCYEPEMVEAYRSSMLKAYRKTVEEGIFTFVIVDDRNLRVADFAQFWAIGKSSGYEVYILEATYKDPEGCAARNIHGFTVDNIQKMAGQWEEVPVLYLQLDIKSLFHSDDLKEGGIQEVDMDMDMEDDFEGTSTIVERKNENPIGFSGDSNKQNEYNLNDGERWDAEDEHPLEQIGALGRSKWSDDLEELENDINVPKKDTVAVLSYLDRARGKSGKSVHWGDQGGDTGFSLAKKANAFSLIIGPGAGYNMKSNPLSKEEKWTQNNNGSGTKRKNVFQEQILAEQESFKAVFERRRQRLGGLVAEDN